MKIIGVTGTNGKTTCVYLICNLLKHRFNCASFGTLGINHYVGNDCWLTKTSLTTLGNLELHDNLAKVKAKGCKLIAMEASSHGLDQNRVAGVDFYKAVFTNLSHEHLDYHKNMDNYFDSKVKLFVNNTKCLQQVIINLDDPYGVKLIKLLIDFLASNKLTNQIKIIGYTTSSMLELQDLLFKHKLHNQIQTITCENIRFSQERITAMIQTPWGSSQITCKLLGMHNLSNLLASIASCADQLPFQDLIKQIEQLSPPPGRLEKINIRPTDLPIIIDYAHTPAGLKNAIQAIQQHYNNQNICCIFGCGGDRDILKRPKMLAVAAKYCTSIILTQDNPRCEDPKKIMNDILSGSDLKTTDLNPEANIIVCLDRKQAICYAIEKYYPNHIILIAGKGHETEQIIGNYKLPFYDNLIAQQALDSINLDSINLLDNIDL